MISGNEFGVEGVNSLHEALRANKTLKKLRLYGKEKRRQRNDNNLMVE